MVVEALTYGSHQRRRQETGAETILARAEGRVPGGPKWRGRPIRLLSFFNSFFFSFSYFVFFFLFFLFIII